MLNHSSKLIAASLLMSTPGFAPSAGADEWPRVPASGVARTGAIATQAASAIGLTLDFARILTFDVPIRTIVIGNPAIVDGTLSDPSTLVLTGKSVGMTNLIILGEDGQEAANLVVSVAAAANQLTTVYHGNLQQVFSCQDSCRPITPSAPSTPSK